MKKFLPIIFLVIGVLSFWTTFADNAAAFDQQRFNDLAGQLRCLVCQNESLVDSTAPLAVDLKKQMITLMQQGKSNEEIVHYLTQRYGEFVLFKPTLTPKNYLLWFGPFVLLILGLSWLAYVLKRKKRLHKNIQLTDEEKQRLEQLLK